MSVTGSVLFMNLSVGLCLTVILSVHFFYKNQIIFVEARCSYSKMAKISNFAHTLPLFYAFKMLFRMSTFISNNSMIRNFASS